MTQRERELIGILIDNGYKAISKGPYLLTKDGEYIDRKRVGELTVEVEKALTKQMPKQPTEVEDIPDTVMQAGRCPRCGDPVISDERYCHECGQRLDWGKSDANGL